MSDDVGSSRITFSEGSSFGTKVPLTAGLVCVVTETVEVVFTLAARGGDLTLSEGFLLLTD